MRRVGSCSVRSLILKAINELYESLSFWFRNVLDRIMAGVNSNENGLQVQELLDQGTKIEWCLLTVLIQWGMLHMRVLLIRGEEEE